MYRDEVIRSEEIMLERAGLCSRNGQKIWNYLAMSYRYYCGECKSELEGLQEITSSVKQIRGEWHGYCECGWTTVEFKEVGI